MIESFNSFPIWLQIVSVIASVFGSGVMARMWSDWLVNRRDGENSLRGDLMKRIEHLETMLQKQADAIAVLREENGKFRTEVVYLKEEIEKLEKSNRSLERRLKKETKEDSKE